MVFFALSCFGLLMFLWLAFGGPTPLKPKGYEFKIAFDEVSQLATQSDVRVAGVEIGKVVKVDRSAGRDAVVATLEIDRKYAPVCADAKAQIRNKTILGQTYVELTLGLEEPCRSCPTAACSTSAASATSSTLDEILNTLDPYTRQRLPDVAAGRLAGGRRPRRRAQRRDRQPAGVRRVRRRPVRGARREQAGARRAREEHRASCSAR